MPKPPARWLDFVEKGFVVGNSRGVESHLARNPGISHLIRHFKPGALSTHSKGSMKFSTLDVFGEYFTITYLATEGNKKKVSDYLLKRFLEHNPHPSLHLKGLFTRWLVDHNLPTEYRIAGKGWIQQNNT